MKKLNIARLVGDVGGPTKITEKTGICRTTPYRWMTSNFISNRHLEALVTAFDISLDHYFEETNDERSNHSRT
jgi:hypothetical protein